MHPTVCGAAATDRNCHSPGEFTMSDAAKTPEVPLTPATGQPASIQIPVDASKMQTVYANFFRLSLSSSMEEVLVDIGLHTGIMQSQNVAEPLQFTHRLVLNPFVAKRLKDSLSQIILRHEQLFGVLEVDAQKRLRQRPQ